MLPSLHFLAAATGQPVGWHGRAIPAGAAERPVLAMSQPSIDGYRIDRIIGAGRVATVYVADDLRRGGNVALKFLKGSCGESDAIRQGFAAECAILSAIRHQHVVRAIEHHTGSAPCYLAMEYLGGGSLRERMRSGVGPEQAFALLRQAAAGLAPVHRLAVVHRDLKPENFLMRWPGEMVLIDLGVAAGRGDSAARVAPGRLVGTAAYTAPEQAQGEPPDAAADVYSLGIVFYEMLCGRRPFAGTTVLEVLSQHLVAPVPRLPATFAAYQALIDRMLEKRPLRRLPDADAVLQEIEHMAAAGIASTTS
jgi:eukaryotic-like serine/threonine-protein kinase